MKYKVCIRETVEGEFAVDAQNREEAYDIAYKKYKECEFVNEPGNLLDLEISVEDINGDYNEWRDNMYSICGVCPEYTL